MNFIKRIALLISVSVTLVASLLVILFVSNLVDYRQILVYLKASYDDQTLRIAWGSLAAVMICVNFILFKLFSVNVHRDRVIAFDNPAGRVSVSLVALEDIIKKMVLKIDEVKDTKIVIKAVKNGLQATLKLAILSDINIPNLTSKIQEVVKRKIHDTIGIEGVVDVTIHVRRILPDQAKMKNREVADVEAKSDRTVPFHGYRA